MVLLTLLAILAAQPPAPPAEPPDPPDPADALPRPTAAQVEWADAEVGMFIHFAPNTWQDNEYDNLSTPLDRINPDKLDTEQWVSTAKAMHAGYIVFVAKHAGGFCWWQTDTTDYSVKRTPWRGGKGDVMADLAASCRKHGVRLGVYLSPQDKKHGVEVGGRCASPPQQAAYESIFRAQLTELLTRYGPIFEVWFDGSLVFDVGDILDAHAPHAIVFQGPRANIRWVGNEDGVAPYPCWNGAVYDPATWGELTASQGVPGGDRWLPSECDARFRNTWFWNTTNAPTLKSVPMLLEMYERSVGHGAVLLLNHTPDPTGAIPEADVRRAAEFGDQVRRRYGAAVADTAGRGAAVDLNFSAPREIDRVVIMEDIARGERVRRYEIEGLTAGGWTRLAEGSAVGHKRIQPIARTRVAALRLRIPQAVGEPIIRRFAAFDTAPTP